ncbi:ATP-binding cassette domain-containing protein [Chloroflexota bacterium]
MHDVSNSETHVDVQDVTFAFGKLIALEALSLTVPRGITFGLLGPNGSGKTTLIRLMVGLLRPQQGTIRVLGETSPHKISRHIGYMPQLPALYGELSVEENVNFFAVSTV